VNTMLRSTRPKTLDHLPEPPARLRGRPLLLTPTIVVALDQQGADVAERLASLVRANIRGPRDSNAAAVRERFGFIRLLHDPDTPVVTEVQAIAVDPSERLWNVADETWQYHPLRDRRAVSFAAALRQVISDVLHYTLAEEELRDRNIMVQPSNLNVFFIGALVHSAPLTLDESLVQALGASDASAPSWLSQDVERRLDEIRAIAERVRLYAEESASLDLVVRGAFLSLVLPVDSYGLARESIQRHGTTLGKLLTPPGAAEYVDLVGYKEPALHFCALYTDHDERGAWYDAQQLTNMIASAIFALMQSELLENGTCATQLGLRDPYAGPYERMVSIAATRSSLPRADLLDYASLQYGAYLLDRLLPQSDGPLSSAERAQVKPIVDELICQRELRALVQRGDDPPWDKLGQPSLLSSLAIDAAYVPPDLRELIPAPRASWRSAWTAHVHTTLRELTRLDQLSVYLDVPLVGDDGASLPLGLPDGAGAFTYDQEPLLLAWHRWRQAMDGRVNHPDDGEVMRRIAAVCQELDRRFWGASPKGVPLSGARYCAVLLELLNESMREAQGLLRGHHLPSPPSATELETELERARERGLVRVGMSVLVALALLFVPLALYLLLAIRTSAADDRFAAFLRRPPLTLALPNLDWIIEVPIVLMVAALLGLGLLAIGLIVRQWQTLQAISGIRAYARLIRRKYALLMYRDEQQLLDSIPEQILIYRQFLQRSLQETQAAARRAAERLRERATAISDRGFRDISEYLPTVRGGPQEIYQRLIQPRMADHADGDLPRLRRDAQELCPFAGASVQTDEQAIEQRAHDAIRSLVLGDPEVSEQDRRARLRYLAYQSLQHDLEEVVQQTVTQATLQRAQDLQERTHLMLRTGYRQGVFAYQRAYLVAAIRNTDEKPELAEIISVRGLDQDTVMYARVANAVWPRLFEGAGVELQ
jgi:hypothetical protein